MLPAISKPDPIHVGALPPPSFTEPQLAEQGAHIRIQPEAGYVANLATLQQAARAAGHLALALYRERKFDQACAAFKALAADRPEIALYAIYAQRAAEFAAVAPPVDWDGATTFETK